MDDASLLPADITFAGKDANLPFKFLLFLRGFSIIAYDEKWQGNLGFKSIDLQDFTKVLTNRR